MELKLLKNSKEILAVLNEFTNCLEALGQGISFRKKMADKFSLKAEFLLGKENDENIGFIAYYANNDADKTVYISMIAVSFSHRRQGVGELLLEKCISDAMKRKMQFVKLEVKKDNWKARCFYEKNGFTVEKESSKNNLYMRKILERC